MIARLQLPARLIIAVVAIALHEARAQDGTDITTIQHSLATIDNCLFNVDTAIAHHAAGNARFGALLKGLDRLSHPPHDRDFDKSIIADIEEKVEATDYRILGSHIEFRIDPRAFRIMPDKPFKTFAVVRHESALDNPKVFARRYQLPEDTDDLDDVGDAKPRLSYYVTARARNMTEIVPDLPIQDPISYVSFILLNAHTDAPSIHTIKMVWTIDKWTISKK